jgi:hypothetical protein
VKINVTKRAERRIEIIDRYWREHRSEAPDLLKQELNSARLRLAQNPVWAPHLDYSRKRLNT